MELQAETARECDTLTPRPRNVVPLPVSPCSSNAGRYVDELTREELAAHFGLVSRAGLAVRSSELACSCPRLHAACAACSLPGVYIPRRGPGLGAQNLWCAAPLVRSRRAAPCSKSHR